MDKWGISMPCQICGSDKDLRKSHIVADTFSKELRVDGEAPQILGGMEPLAKRAPGGIYEQDLLCQLCETRTSVWENEAARVLIQEEKAWTPIENEGCVVAWSFDGADLTSIRLFFIQLILKASLSSLEQFEKLDLGRFEDSARQMVLAGDPGPLGLFNVVLARYEVSKEMPGLERSMQLPVTGNIKDCPMIMTALNGFRATIRISDAPFPDGVEGIAVGISPQLFALSKPFDDQHGIGVVKRMVAGDEQTRLRRGWKPRR